jgi:biopolymer transport protein ExbD
MMHQARSVTCPAASLVAAVIATFAASFSAGTAPRALSAPPAVEGFQTLRIGVDAQGAWIVNDRASHIAAFHRHLREAAERPTPPRIEVVIDPRTSFDRVVQLLEQAHYEGFSQLDFGIAPSEPNRTGRVRVRLDAEGRATIGERPGPAGLLDILNALSRGEGDAIVEFDADPRTPYSHLHAVMEGIAVGVDRVAIHGRTFQIVRQAPRLPAVFREQPQPPARGAEPNRPGALQHGELMQLAQAARSLAAELRAARDHALRNAGIEAPPPPVLTEQERALRRAAHAALDGLTADQLHALLRAIEQDMFTLYRETLAAHAVAADRSVTYQAAYANTVVLRPSRGDRRPTDAQPADHPGMTARDEAELILDTCRRLLAHAHRGPPPGPSRAPARGDAAALNHRGPNVLPDALDRAAMPHPEIPLAAPGRRLDALDHTDREWLHIDTWYILGPLPLDNRRRASDVGIGPGPGAGPGPGPGTRINLLDAFTGSRDRRVTWQYRSAGLSAAAGQRAMRLMITPHDIDRYAVYYAWTEIHTAEPRQVWIATGADDYGKLWVNDELVWVSPAQPRPFHPIENIQLIDLRRGHNGILFRFENAGGITGFSLMLHPSE